MVLNTYQENINIISAIQDAWKYRFKNEFPLSFIQEIHISTDLLNIPNNNVGVAVDTSVVYFDEMEPDRYVNSKIYAIVFNYFHRQFASRIDCYSITIYLKDN